jgi:hypothetical protein
VSRRIRFGGWIAGVIVLLGFYPFAVAEPPALPAEAEIRKALEGQPLPATTGDGILDDVLHIIRDQGSILEGSSLDPAVETEAGDREVATSQHARAAEQLLKASRLLEKLGPVDEDRRALVNQMRAEAGKLLRE